MIYITVHLVGETGKTIKKKRLKAAVSVVEIKIPKTA